MRIISRHSHQIHIMRRYAGDFDVDDLMLLNAWVYLRNRHFSAPAGNVDALNRFFRLGRLYVYLQTIPYADFLLQYFCKGAYSPRFEMLTTRKVKICRIARALIA